MFNVEFQQDEVVKDLRWLRVTHNGVSWSTIPVRSDDEALQIISALQQGVQLTGLCPECHRDTLRNGVCINSSCPV